MPAGLHSSALWALAGFFLLCFSISSDSIDMDEAQTWDYARLETFSEFRQELAADPNSEAQMPLGMFSFWAWSRIFGTGEPAMRSLNLVWAGIALAALALVGSRARIPWLPMLFSIQPFVWYCMNHARTPVMQMAGGALLLSALASVIAAERFRSSAVACACAGAVLLTGASMLGSIPAAASATAILVFASRAKHRPILRHWAMLSVAAAVLAALGAYYASTLLRGAGGARIWAVSPLNLVFAASEFLGFIGLGPGRQELRAVLKGQLSGSGLAAAVPPFLLLATTYAGLFFSAARLRFSGLQKADEESRIRRSLLRASALILLSSALLLYALALWAGFPFWGRHLAGVFPFWTTALGIVISGSAEGPLPRWRSLLCMLLISLLAISSARLRLSATHLHDDYRSAAAAASELARSGLQVWWVADRSGGSYYALAFGEPYPSCGRVMIAHNMAEGTGPTPDALVISRPENFDARGTATRLIRSGAYSKQAEFPAFEIWKKP